MTVSEVRETELPGVGTRFDFQTSDGSRLAVLVHRSGRREILVYDDPRDPDRCRTTLSLNSDETSTLVELLGASRITAHLSSMQLQLEDLTIDWLEVHPGSRWAERTLQDAAVHTRTGVSVVAILRGGDTIPAPGAETRILPGDRLVAVGQPDGVAQLGSELLGE
ncbi:MAG TPA: cation:proton antiporter regulatory subunit [Acidimicrobiia bacterium]